MIQFRIMAKNPELQIGGQKFILKIGKKTRGLRLSVYPDGRAVISAPSFLGISTIEQFVKGRMDWVKAKLEAFTPFRRVLRRKNSRAEYAKYKDDARKLVEDRILVLNKHYGFRVGRISIKNQKSRWGSCSAKGNLNFNYKIVFLPKDIADYIIVHELCHLRELNHSRSFWKLVAQVVPDYLKLRNELRRQGVILG